MDKKNDYNPNTKFWRSVGEFYNGRSEVESNFPEFPEAVTEEFEVKKMNPISRRQFMALLGASSAFAMASCTDYRDKGEIISYNNKPDYANYGDSIFYSSALNDGSAVLIKTREGRPIKIDGNPDHPVYKGKVDVKAQASIMNLYDPSRLRNPLKKSDSPLVINQQEMQKADWADIDKLIKEKLDKANDIGKQIAIITHSVLSPTQKKVLDDFVAKYPTTKVYSYELHYDNNKRKAWEKCYGSSDYPTIKWNEANIILTLEGDFLGNEGNVAENIRLFSERRNVINVDNFNRLYSVEAGMSLTGINSDYRFRLSPEFQMEFILMLFKELNINLAEALIDLSKAVSANDFASKHSLDLKKLNYLINDLKNNIGKSIIYAGDSLPEDCQIAVNALNKALANENLYCKRKNKLHYEYASHQDWMELFGSIDKGNVSVLINFDVNPVFHFAHKEYIEALKKVETKISLTETLNESIENNDFILPINHAFESWNDFENQSGILTLQQPVIEPLYDSRQKEAVLLNWISDDIAKYNQDIYHKYLMNRWEQEVYINANVATNFSKFWYSCLHDGVYKLGNPDNEFRWQMTEFKPKSIQKNDFTVILSKNYSIADGRYANNGWLQEVPHPVTKAAWDNYAAISPTTAKALTVKNNDVISVSVGNNIVELPVMEQPGMADKVIAVETGYGRTIIGDVGKDVGVNVHSLIGSKGNLSEWILTGAAVAKTSKTYDVYSTQEHHPVDEDFVKDFHFSRDIIQEGTVEEYKKDKKFLKHEEHNIESINPLREYKGKKWAMAIDMNKCVSCNNCVTSCNVENNIPVVGKDQVGRGREMHWMRLDRYYSGTPDEPKVSVQPMLCQHCDHAPCENVCPVAATNHSEDGLNQMVYNRCVGTRYCANNCPYKVRRFNFYNFRSEFANSFYEQDSVALQHNPEVTVRSRGVMEKCTFCIQRIMEARQEAIKEGRELKGDEIKTACQVACPADAITFGDANDAESDIAKAREHDLGYSVLELLNVRPNVTYLAKLRNIYSEDV